MDTLKFSMEQYLFGAGFLSGEAGLAWTGFTTVLSLPKDSQSIRVRNGEEVHQVEVIGRRGNTIEHMELLILVDPFRTKAGHNIKQWILHGEHSERDIVTLSNGTYEQ